MKTLTYEQFIPASLDQVWDFFSSPHNLDLITPPQMKFKIISEQPEKVYPGLIIRYIIKPMLSIPMRWVTEITEVKEQVFFIDEQRKGPYRVWHHEHHFKSVEGGVLMTDKLMYDIGMGPLGWLAGKIWVDRQVVTIFDYRRKIIMELF